MDVYSLKQHIIHNENLIELILENVGFHKIRDLGNEIRCARDEGRNPTSIKINKSTLSTVCFSTNIKGDIITLVQEKLNITFPEALKLIGKIINFDFNDTDIQIQLPFGGYYKKIGVNREQDIRIKTYSEDILKQYEKRANMMFFQDGISQQVQEKYGVGYDVISGRITVPWYSLDMELCGVMGRLNKREVDEYEIKWFPLIPFEKSKTLFGYNHNYKTIQEMDCVLVGESEKFSLQLASMGMDVGLSLGGNHMSEIQSNHIKALFASRNIVALDEGLPEDHSREMAEKLKFNNFFQNNVGYIFDRENRYMPMGSKVSPSDLGKETLQKLIKECTVWI